MRTSLITILTILLSGCRTVSKPETITRQLESFVKDKDADIGIAVIINGKDTLAVNGDKPYPMLSVYKLPIAIALGDFLKSCDKMQSDTVMLTESDMHPDTYSPMRDRYSDSLPVKTTLDELLAYSLQQSDNNASDILLKIAGGPQNVMTSLRRLGVENINVVSTEDDMHANPDLCYENTSTPIAMASLIDRFDRESNDPFSLRIKELMESCTTGTARLTAPLKTTDAVIGHKTGTGFILADGRIMAVNDAGYIHLPDGTHYSIAVFIRNSGYTMEETEAIIAEISHIVVRSLVAD